MVENPCKLDKISKVSGHSISRSSFLTRKTSPIKIFRHHKTRKYETNWSVKIQKFFFVCQTSELCLEMTEKLSFHNQRGQKVSSDELFAALYESGPQTDHPALTG